MSLVRSGFTASQNNSQQQTFASWNYMVNMELIHIDRPLQKLSITNIAFICLSGCLFPAFRHFFIIICLNGCLFPVFRHFFISFQKIKNWMTSKTGS
jgi:hypothetical protein